MRAWIVAGVVVIGVAILGGIAFTLLVPPTSGSGWQLDLVSSWEPVPPVGAEPTVVLYASTDSAVGIGVTAFGSSSCPPQLRSVDIVEDEIRVVVADPLVFGGCTADAAPHQFGIAVQRDRIPELPFRVVVRHGDAQSSVTEVQSLP